MTGINIDRADVEGAMSKPQNMMTEIEKIAIRDGWKPTDWPSALVVDKSKRTRGALSLISVAAETAERAQCLKILAQELFAQSMWSGFSDAKKTVLIDDFEASMRQSIQVVGSMETVSNTFNRSHLIEAVTAFVLRGNIAGLATIQNEIGRLKGIVPLGAGDELLSVVEGSSHALWEASELSKGV